MSESAADVAAELPSVGLAAGRDVWVVLPTYNERENVERIANAILASLPEASLLIVDDSSPDGTGELADTIAAREPRVSVLHRPAKQGLGVAYRDGFRWVLERPDARAVVQMDADFSHDPADLPRLLAPLMGNADLVLGTRYMRGGSTVGWPWYRRLISRGGTLFARTVLLLPVPRPDRWVQGLAARAARVDPPERDLRLGVRLPGGDDLVGASSRRQHRPGADRLPGADRRSVEDDRRDRRRGDEAGRQPARGCGRRVASTALGHRLHPGQASARMAARPNPAADQGRTPSRRMTNYR